MNNKFYWFFCVGLFASDQLSKYLARYIDKAYLNTGGVLGLIPGKHWLWLTIIVLLVLVGLTKRWESYSPIERVGFLIILISGASNSLDRIFWGGVWDWIVYPYINVVGNLADVYLGVGAALFIFDQLYNHKPQQND